MEMAGLLPGHFFGPVVLGEGVHSGAGAAAFSECLNAPMPAAQKKTAGKAPTVEVILKFMRLLSAQTGTDDAREVVSTRSGRLSGILIAPPTLVWVALLA